METRRVVNEHILPATQRASKTYNFERPVATDRNWPYKAPMKTALVALMLLVGFFAQADMADQIDRVVQAEVASHGFQGNVFVHGPNEIIFAKSYGLADLEFNVPNSRETIFRVGSISKQFTAVGVLRLLADGKIKSLDDRIGDYLAVPAHWKDITIHHLLTHTSGVQRDPPLMTTGFSTYHTVSELFDSISSAPLLSLPGATYSYSNAGYEVLARFIEKCSGKDFAEYMAIHVFGPAGLKNTKHDSDFEIVPNRASGYLVNAGRLFNQAGFDLSNVTGAGRFISTVDDLYKWDQVLESERVLPSTVRDLLFKPYVTFGSKAYGYGWVIDQWKGHKVVWHDGRINGYASDFAKFVDDKVVVIILSNRYDAGASIMRIREKVADLVLGVVPTAPNVKTPPAR